MTTNEAAERLRVSIDERIAKLNPGQGWPKARNDATKRWCRVHLEHVRDEALAALAAAKAEGWSEGYRAARLAGALDDEAPR